MHPGQKKAAWAALLARFPAPTVVITDGGAGIAAALSECWSETAVQRCLVHVQRNVRTYLTGRPRTEAGKALLRLGRALTRITTAPEAAAWLGGLNNWYQENGHLVRARTYRNGTAIVPGWVRANQSWWFTHDRLRKAYRLLERLSRAGTLFTYLHAEHAGLNIAPTTNRIEGARLRAECARTLKNSGVRYWGIRTPEQLWCRPSFRLRIEVYPAVCDEYQPRK